MLRQRHTGLDGDADDEDTAAAESEHLVLTMEAAKRTSAAALEASGTDKSGHLLKKGHRCGNLCCCLKPVWKKRYFILKGGYLFRFSSPRATAPKGTPIPVESGRVSFGGDEDRDDDHVTFTLSTLRKEFVLSARTREDRDAWVQALREAKEKAIKHRMGHLPRDKADADVGRMGTEMYEASLRREQQEAEQGMELKLLNAHGMGMM